VDLSGVFDLHVHAGPDARPRKMDAAQLAKAASSVGMRGFLLKNHYTSTVGQAHLLNQMFPALRIFGGLALNESIGGLNSQAVDAALKMGAAKIWMPTYSSAYEYKFHRINNRGITVLDSDDKLLPAVIEILQLIAEKQAVLGLGHLSPKEMLAVVRAAKEIGVGKIVINHPEINFLNLSIEFQRELKTYGVYFERCYVRANSAVDWDGFVQNIKELGFESTIIATDLGQPNNPDPISGMQEMLEELSKRGFTRYELETMACHNPAKLLNIS
jgi:hypothetical protein